MVNWQGVEATGEAEQTRTTRFFAALRMTSRVPGHSATVAARLWQQSLNSGVPSVLELSRQDGV
jgi:hypothetical protein